MKTEQLNRTKTELLARLAADGKGDETAGPSGLDYTDVRIQIDAAKTLGEIQTALEQHNQEEWEMSEMEATAAAASLLIAVLDEVA